MTTFKRRIKTNINRYFCFYFRSETTIFTEWLEKTKRIVTEKERTMSLQRNDGSVSELLGDVISHQADLRFITMAGQKFTDESKVCVHKLTVLLICTLCFIYCDFIYFFWEGILERC